MYATKAKRMGDAAPRRLRWHRLHGVSSEVKGGINGRLIRNRSCLRAAFLLGRLGWRPSFLERRHPRCLGLAVRPEGANHQWRKIPPRELSIDLVADERLGRVTGRAGASGKRPGSAVEQAGGPEREWSAR